VALEVLDLRKEFDGLVAVDQVSFRVEHGKVTALIGPNGSGKTTIFHLITGLVVPTRGDVVLDGRSLRGLAPFQVFRQGVARTFQNIRLFRDMSVMENVMLVHRYAGGGETLAAAIARRRLTKKEDETARAAALSSLKMVGLEAKKDALAGTLSHGQRKLLELARAVAADAQVLLLDEPTAGVFPDTREKIHQLVRQLASAGRMILFIEHDMRFVASVADQIIALNHGCKIAEGAPDVVLANEAVVAAFLGPQAHVQCRAPKPDSDAGDHGV